MPTALVVRLVGAPADLARSEIRSVLGAQGILYDESEPCAPTLWVAEADAVVPEAVWGRLAFSHEVARCMGRVDLRDEGALDQVLEAALPDGTFAVRAERVAPPHGAGPRSAEVERRLGAGWAARGHRVDLDDPDVVVRAFLDAQHIHVGLRLWHNDAGAYERRAAKHRPYFSPVSGHPRWMRALVNCTAVPLGGLLYDPVCGTGGTLIEAALAGLRVVGSDLDPHMVEGTRTNLAHFDLTPEALFVADVRAASEAFGEAMGRAPDGIVADLPYGQSASTQGATARDVARWTLASCVQLLEPGRRAVIGTSDPSTLEPVPHGLRVVARFANRVHKTMTRHYMVFERTDL